MLGLHRRRLSSCAHVSKGVVNHGGVEEGERGEGIDGGEAGGDDLRCKRFEGGMEAVKEGGDVGGRQGIERWDVVGGWLRSWRGARVLRCVRDRRWLVRVCGGEHSRSSLRLGVRIVGRRRGGAGGMRR